MKRSKYGPGTITLGFIVAGACLIAVAARAGGTAEALPSRGLCHPAFSSDGRFLVLSGPADAGVYVFDLREKTLTILTENKSSGYAFSLSPDGKRLGFKAFERDASGVLMQVSTVYDTQTRTMQALTPPLPRAGIPSFSNDGKTAVTVNEMLYVLDARYQVESSYELGGYANLAPISPDGTHIAFNDQDDQIWLLDLSTNERVRVNDGREGWFWPLWSPDGTKLALSTLSGNLAVYDLASCALYGIGRGARPAWSPGGQALLYGRTQGEPGENVSGSDLFMSSWDGSWSARLTESAGEYFQEGAIHPSSGTVVYFEASRNQLLQAPLGDADTPAVRLGKAGALDLSRVPKLKPSGHAKAPVLSPEAAPVPEAVISIPNVPYLHQVYDTPDWFNGNWACNATSAAMPLAYYHILPCWDCTVSVPSSHVSHWGRYVCEVYSYNGTTYNVGSPDASGTTAYGGYGYIVRNNWQDTRDYLRDYLANHGLENDAVDGSATWAKVQAEAGASHPVVYLTTITSAGHYIVGIGYFSGQHTAVFNDPYGNKNQGYPNYNGAGAYYDWPSYNNGYQNLNSVVCLIYARSSIQACTSSGAFSLTSPANGQSLPGATSSVTLSWGASGYGDTYDIYFGTSSNPPFLANQAASSTSRSVSVSPGTTYYWTIKARVGCDSTYACPAGPWSFTVQALPKVVPYSVTPTRLMTTTHGTSGTVTWDAADCASANYHLIYGYGSALASWSVSGGRCGLGTSGSCSWTSIPDPSSDVKRFLWFLVVGDDGGQTEGSWGHTSSGQERGGTAASGACGMTTKNTAGACGTP